MISYLRLTLCLSIFFLAGFRQAHCCMCGPDHPQNIFCYSEYAVKIFVKSSRDVTIDGQNNIAAIKIPEGGSIYDFMDGNKAIMTEYRVRILKTFKGDVEENKTTTMYTPAFSFLCKRDLKSRHSYFMMGNKHDGRLQINLCNYVMDVTYESVSVVRQLTRNFRLRYPKTCGHCRICHHITCYDKKKIDNQCKWPRDVSLFDINEATKYSCVPKTGADNERRCSLRYPFKKILDNGETTVIPSEVPSFETTTPPPLPPTEETQEEEATTTEDYFLPEDYKPEP